MQNKWHPVCRVAIGVVTMDLTLVWPVHITRFQKHNCLWKCTQCLIRLLVSYHFLYSLLLRLFLDINFFTSCATLKRRRRPKECRNMDLGIRFVRLSASSRFLIFFPCLARCFWSALEVRKHDPAIFHLCACFSCWLETLSLTKRPSSFQWL